MNKGSESYEPRPTGSREREPEMDRSPDLVRPDLAYPEGPSTQCLMTLVPNTIQSMVFGARDLKYWVLGPSGIDRTPQFHEAGQTRRTRPCCTQSFLQVQ